MRALLDLLRDYEAAEYQVPGCQSLLYDASRHLKILDPEHGEKELVKSFEVAKANWPGYELFR